MKKIELELTEEEINYLTIEMNCLLRSYKTIYNGQKYDNEDMGNAFNKIYKALTGKNHETWLKVNK